MTDRPHLDTLAQHCGILPGYERTDGQWKPTAEHTQIALLKAMGFDASSESNCENIYRELCEARSRQVLDPVRVVKQGAHDLSTLPLRIAGDSSGSIEWNLELECEDGALHRCSGKALDPGNEIHVPVPEGSTLPLGYHRLRWRCSGAFEAEAEQLLIVVPEACQTVHEVIGDQRAFGFYANLYTLRSNQNWGVGDVSDLRTLIGLAAKSGAEFIGINPLHALDPVDPVGCPYYPVSRLYRNILYLDIPAIPELQECKAAQDRIASNECQEEISALRDASDLDYPHLVRLKHSILKELHDYFRLQHRAAGTERGRAYREFLAQEGKDLENFATFQVLREHVHESSATERNWQSWAADFQDPNSAAVQKFRLEHEQDVDYQCYLQFELDRQLAELQALSRDGGLRIGIYQDLALGSAPSGSDGWAFDDLFARGATLGAPPDPFSATGQDWDLVPIVPHRLTETAYRYWSSLLRNAFRHTGALRIDHIMALVRQFWVPEGMLPTEGAYVQYPEEDLLGILALESRRSGSIVIGEDLGTVPPGLRETMEHRGILRSQVLYFERYWDGSFRHPNEYAREALTSANTHDLATLPGYWTGHDLELRRSSGAIPDDEVLQRERQQRDQERGALLHRFREHGILGWEQEISSPAEFTRASYVFIARTPSRLISVSLDDLGEEQEPINVPGPPDLDHRSWGRRMTRNLEELSQDSRVQECLEALDGRKSN